MTTTPEREPTLTDVLEKIDNISEKVSELSRKVKKMNDNFSDYITPEWMIRWTFGLVFSCVFGLFIFKIIFD